jgi:hypothetical protein
LVGTVLGPHTRAVVFDFERQRQIPSQKSGLACAIGSCENAAVRSRV